MALVFSELFEGVEGDDLVTYSANWTRSSSTVNGRAIIVSGRARHNSAGVAAYYYRNDFVLASADCTVRGKFYFPTVPGSGQSLGICARGATGAQSFYFLRALGGTGFVLARSVNNTSSTLGTYSYTFVAETEVVAELKVVGDQISAYVDGALVLGPFTDATFGAAGVIGIRSINGATAIQLSEMSADDGVSAGVSGTAVPAGVTATAAVGSVTASAGAKATPPGVTATASVGNATASAGVGVTAMPVGVGASASIGTATATGGARATPAGVNATGQVGQVTASAGGSGTANPAGVGAISGVGIAAASAGARVAPAGVMASASVGSVIASANLGIDLSKISPARIVVFEGSGSRVTPFGSSGSRVTPYDSSGSRVTPFEGSGSKTVRFE